MKAKENPNPTGNLAGATSEAPQGKSAPSPRPASAEEAIEFEVLKIEEAGDELHIYEAGGGRLICAATKDVKRVKGDGSSRERVRITRGKFTIAI